MPWQIVVTMQARPEEGTYRDNVLVETTDPDVPRLVIPIKAFVR